MLIKTRTSLQSIDVLCVHPEELPLLVQQTHEVVCQVGLVVPRIQLFGQGEEGDGVSVKEADFKYGFGIREVVLLQVVVETTAWRPTGPGDVLIDGEKKKREKSI